MPSDKPETRRLDAATLKAFSHPLRMRLYDLLKDGGPATASMLAREIGESTGQTSYHLRQLERHGLIAEDTGRGTGRERWWHPIGFRFDADTEEDRLAGQAVLQHWTRATADHLTEWGARQASEDIAWVQHTLHSESTVAMTKDEMNALGDELTEVITRHVDAAKAAAADEPSDRRTVKIYGLAFPLPRKPDAPA